MNFLKELLFVAVFAFSFTHGVTKAPYPNTSNQSQSSQNTQIAPYLIIMKDALFGEKIIIHIRKIDPNPKQHIKNVGKRIEEYINKNHSQKKEENKGIYYVSLQKLNISNYLLTIFDIKKQTALSLNTIDNLLFGHKTIFPIAQTDLKTYVEASMQPTPIAILCLQINQKSINDNTKEFIGKICIGESPYKIIEFEVKPEELKKLNFDKIGDKGMNKLSPNEIIEALATGRYMHGIENYEDVMNNRLQRFIQSQLMQLNYQIPEGYGLITKVTAVNGNYSFACHAIPKVQLFSQVEIERDQDGKKRDKKFQKDMLEQRINNIPDSEDDDHEDISNLIRQEKKKDKKQLINKEKKIKIKIKINRIHMQY